MWTLIAFSLAPSLMFLLAGDRCLACAAATLPLLFLFHPFAAIILWLIALIWSACLKPGG